MTKERGAGPLLMDAFASMADDARIKLVEKVKRPAGKASRKTLRKQPPAKK